MQYLRVLQREKDKRFDFTCQWDRQIFPVGYCREWRDWDEATRTLQPEAYKKYVADKHKYHSNGHATKQEAADCYRSYLLDTHCSLNRKNENVQYKCQICGEYTELFASIEDQTFILCKEHNTMFELEKLFTLDEDVLIMKS